MRYDRLEPTMQDLEAEIRQLKNALENIVSTLYEGQKTMLKDTFDLGLADKADIEYDKGYDAGYARAVELVDRLKSTEYAVLYELFKDDDPAYILANYSLCEIVDSLDNYHSTPDVGDEVELVDIGGTGIVLRKYKESTGNTHCAVILKNGSMISPLASRCRRTGVHFTAVADVFTDYISK